MEKNQSRKNTHTCEVVPSSLSSICAGWEPLYYAIPVKSIQFNELVRMHSFTQGHLTTKQTSLKTPALSKKSNRTLYNGLSFMCIPVLKGNDAINQDIYRAS